MHTIFMFYDVFSLLFKTIFRYTFYLLIRAFFFKAMYTIFMFYDGFFLLFKTIYNILIAEFQLKIDLVSHPANGEGFD